MTQETYWIEDLNLLDPDDGIRWCESCGVVVPIYEDEAEYIYCASCA